MNSRKKQTQYSSHGTFDWCTSAFFLQSHLLVFLPLAALQTQNDSPLIILSKGFALKLLGQSPCLGCRGAGAGAGETDTSTEKVEAATGSSQNKNEASAKTQVIDVPLPPRKWENSLHHS